MKREAVNGRDGNEKRLYVDMDGVLAVFNNQIESEEVLFQQGYYRGLPPQQNVVDAICLLQDQQPDIDVYILSAVLPSPYAEQEKNEWLDQYLPQIDTEHRIFVPCGEDKGDYIGHTLGDDDLLLDDYSRNLLSWCPPGRALKLMNGINGNFGTWQGGRVSYDAPPAEIAATICENLGVEPRIAVDPTLEPKAAVAATKETGKTDPGDLPTYPPVYRHGIDYAIEHDEDAQFLASDEANFECCRAIDAAIDENFSANSLRDASLKMLKQFGAERVSYVLACTIMTKQADGRLGQDNKAWAQKTGIEGWNKSQRSLPCVLRSHPGLIDIFARQTRRRLQQEPEQKPSMLGRLKQTEAKLKSDAATRRAEMDAL